MCLSTCTQMYPHFLSPYRRVTRMSTVPLSTQHSNVLCNMVHACTKLVDPTADPASPPCMKEHLKCQNLDILRQWT